ncbi:MAG: ABC transporter permease [Thermoanaerobaculia bacterium]|nr:ABC transporter permease [Thermoanaerobaculia bacterium]
MKHSIHIGPLLRSMMRNKTRVLLLTVEIAVTVAVALNCSAMILQQLEVLRRDTGIAENELIGVEVRPWAADYQDFQYRQRIAREDLAAIRAMPGVRNATIINTFPLQGGGSSSLAGPLGSPREEWIRTPVYSADPQVFDTLGLEIVEGRGFRETDIPTEPGPYIANVVVTRDFADALFPEGNAIGQSIDTGGGEEYPDVIVGIVGHMFTPYGGGPMETRITFFPRLPSSTQRSQYLVRAEPGAVDQVYASLTQTFVNVEPRRAVALRTMDEIKAGGYIQNNLMVDIYTVVVLLLLFVTALGIFGITAYSVTQRTKQIGTRRALGAPKQAILHYFLAESTLVSLIGLGLGLIGAYGLNVLLVNHAGAPKLDPVLVLVGSLSLWMLGLLATWAPAQRASRLSPALATRTV